MTDSNYENQINENNQQTIGYDSAQKIEELITEIETKLAESDDITMHTMLIINHLLRDSQTPKFLTEDSKQRIKNIWDKISLSGLELNKPPLIFGAPELVNNLNNVLDENLDDGTDVISITLPPDKPDKEEKPKPKKATKIEEENDIDYDEDEDDSSTETDEDEV
ncbi:MAG: hypothetical protein LBE20_07205 [Deltaproteobacteria bacterium]|jgi:hypothetical protein|nr:hypothetical protein [Deltaproteobacteria bacterium]